MSDEKKDAEDDIFGELAEGVEDEFRELLDQGVKGDDDTFVIIPGTENVFFLINNPPGQEGKALAMRLPPEHAIQLGSSLLSAAIVTSKLDAKLPKTEEKKEVKKQYLN